MFNQLYVSDDNPAWEDGKAAGEQDVSCGAVWLNGDGLVDAAYVYTEAMRDADAPLNDAQLATYYTLGYLAATIGQRAQSQS